MLSALASTDIRPTSVYARTGLLVPVLVYRSPRLAPLSLEWAERQQLSRGGVGDVREDGDVGV